MKKRFKPKNAALLMALATIYPLHVFGAAGITQFAVGDVNVRRGQATVPLNRGQQINAGDNIITGARGQTQIRFSDGGLVSLSPNSQFNIDKYVDENKPEEDGFFASFLRGGMRAITGLVGKRSRENYKITTTTATIGIRGSAFSANYKPDGSIQVSGEQDGIVVCTNAGCVELIVGESVDVTGPNTIPSRTAERSNVPPLVVRQEQDVPVDPVIIQTVEVPTESAPTPVPVPVPVPVREPINGVLPGVSAMFAYRIESFSEAGLLALPLLFNGNGYGYVYSEIDTFPRGGEHPSDGLATFVNDEMVRHEGTARYYYYGPTAASENGSLEIVEKTGTDPGQFGIVANGPDDAALIGWGHWTNARITYQNGQVEQVEDSSYDFFDVHYLVGRPTPLAQMPKTGTASYSLASVAGGGLSGTAPTAWDSYNNMLHTGTLVGGGLNVDFGMGRLNGYIDTVFVVEGQNRAIQISGLGYLSETGASFYSNTQGNGFDYGNNGSFYGFFTGDGASRAGMVYQVYDNMLNGYVQGAAVMFRNGGVGNAFSSHSGLAAVFGEDGANVLPRNLWNGEDVRTGTGYFVGNSLYLHSSQDSYNGGSIVVGSSSPVSNSGQLGELGQPGYVGWGYWAKNTNFDGYDTLGVHHVVGVPTAQIDMPRQGTSNYTLAGATLPTARMNYNDAPIFGVLLPSSSMTADFTNGSVSVQLNTSFKNGTVNVGLGHAFMPINGSSFSSRFVGCGNAEISGFFSGDLAARAGLIYRGYNETVGDITGAAAFQRSTSSGLLKSQPPQ